MKKENWFYAALLGNCLAKDDCSKLKMKLLDAKRRQKTEEKPFGYQSLSGTRFSKECKNFGRAAIWKGFVFRFGGCIPFAGYGDNLQLFLNEIFCYRKIPLVDVPAPLVQPLSRFVRPRGSGRWERTIIRIPAIFLEKCPRILFPCRPQNAV